MTHKSFTYPKIQRETAKSTGGYNSDNGCVVFDKFGQDLPLSAAPDRDRPPNADQLKAQIDAVKKKLLSCPPDQVDELARQALRLNRKLLGL